MVEIDSTPPPDVDSAKARRDHLVNDWLDAKAAAEKHNDIAEQIGESLIRELGVGGRHEVVPGVGVKIQAPASRFDDSLAREVLTRDQYEAILEPRPSVKLAGKLLPGALLDQCKVTGPKPSVRQI